MLGISYEFSAYLETSVIIFLALIGEFGLALRQELTRKKSE
jgi:hypothetical protein